ncbi:TRAP transporter small permease [Rhodobium gokarnense]|uniref:TRAP transporter small permease protein n=1 Tax=Rhodobium gokarnense TaxID=364296 RepID=A0ABT3H7E4_9HYPH|nr:TRAP transporter small permease [Rhodobium gokarnense]MCW2306315.1 TRAP-type C4-dicarboxylate transport system permease small subunit [Rhodobium gokarnense]
MTPGTDNRPNPTGFGSPFLRLIDAAGAACARLGDVLVAAIAAMLCFEVVARYLFNSPTIWAQDIAIAFQVWFTYLGMAYVLRQRQLIRITALLALASPSLRRLADGFALLVILAFSLIAVIYGWDIVAESIRLGRRQPTMLELPNWIVELPVVVGFALLALQALADLVRLPFAPPPEFSPTGEQT